MRKAVVVGAGEMGTAMAELLARGGLDVQLACRTAAQAERIGASTIADVEPAGADLIVIATPLSALSGVVARIGGAIGDRTTVLLPVRGELGAHAVPAARHLRERTQAAAVACLGVPGGARAILDAGASVDLACPDSARCRQLVEALERAGVTVHAVSEPVRSLERRAA
jgi:glycerol-3-phosphate dehydrogenase